MLCITLGTYTVTLAGDTPHDAENLYVNGISERMLYEGENWFKFTTEEVSDLYVKLEIGYGFTGLNAKLYSGGQSVALDYSEYEMEYYLIARGCSSGENYVRVYNPHGEIEVNITTEVFPYTYDKYEPNNWFYNATELTENIDKETYDVIIDGYLGDESKSGHDIDIYQYTASEPCMLTIDYNKDDYDHNYSNPGDLDIYIGNTLYASTYTSGRPGVKKITDRFSFNHTHGDCYFKVYDGFGKYTLDIRRKEYQAKPVILIKNPSSRQLYCEFDTFNPLVSVLGNAELNIYYYYLKNSGPYRSEEITKKVNSKTFTDISFQQLNTSQVVDGESHQNTIQFAARYMSGAKMSGAHMNRLLYDYTQPEYENINVERNENNIEVNIIDASDAIGLAQRPYRYRIYLSGGDQSEYSEWMTSAYYNKWVNESDGDYVVDVQIRDMIAEQYQGDQTKNLDNHITTFITNVGVN